MNNPIRWVDPLGLAWESTPTQGLHYNDRGSSFGFGLAADANGNLRPVPLGGNHTFDAAKANSILNDTVKDKDKWRDLRKQVARDFDNPAYKDKDKTKCSRLGRSMRLAGALGAVAAIANAANSQLAQDARDYMSARDGSPEQQLAAAVVATDASGLGMGDSGALIIYNMLTE